MWLWIVQCYESGHILFICVNMSFHYFKTWLWQVLCALRNKENIKRMYHFEGRIAYRVDYYYRWSCRALRRMHGQICPPWVANWETAGVYHWDRHASLYLTLHSIALHILIISEIDIFLWKLWLINIELVIADIYFDEVLFLRCNFLKCCCWGYVICLWVVDELRAM